MAERIDFLDSYLSNDQDFSLLLFDQSKSNKEYSKNRKERLPLRSQSHHRQDAYDTFEIIALGLKCHLVSSHGKFNKDSVHKLLDIDGMTETAFYALSTGN